jgi:hypothetical protein
LESSAPFPEPVRLTMCFRPAATLHAVLAAAPGGGASAQRRTLVTQPLLALLAAAALACSAPCAARAQQVGNTLPPRADSVAATPLPEGAWVRVTQSAVRPLHVVGTLQFADSQALSIARRGSGDPLTLPYTAVEGLEVRRGFRTTGERAVHGAGRGLVAGLAVTALLVAVGAAADADGCRSDCTISVGGLALMAGIPLTAATTAIGALFGAAGSGERWAAVRTPVRFVPRDPAPAATR